MSMQSSTPKLMGDAVEQGIDLLQAELRLFRAEVSEKLNHLTRGLMFLILGGLSLIVALFVLISALVDLLSALGLPRYGADLTVGLGVALVGVLLLVLARPAIRAALRPLQTLAQFRKDAMVVTAQVK